MSMIKIQKIAKSFKTYKSEWHRVFNWFIGRLRPIEKKVILKDVSLEIEAGESIGIIGQNGSGKSTLLKILAGTMQPDKGSIEVKGRVAALLELGMGFNTELTGRTNVFNTAGLMGYTQDQIDAVMDEIEDFAEIGPYFNEPLRTYSSGMQVRLAFAVATAFRPEILIVDEALSVGDAYFQHKSYNRIKEFCELGTTLLLVSHDRSAIASLCDRVILIHDGLIAGDGKPEEVLDLYNAVIAAKEGYRVKQIQNKSGNLVTVSGTGEATIKAISLNSQKSTNEDTINVGEEVILEVIVSIHQSLDELSLGYLIKDRLGQSIFGTNTHHMDKVIYNLKSGDEYKFRFKFCANLGVGNYSIAVALHKSDIHLTHNYEWRDFALTFTVVNPAVTKFVGTSWIPPELDILK